jgi:toxin ParE1/3/4
VKRLVLAAAAKEDLASVASYTEREWGRDQKQRYMGALLRKMIQIRSRRGMGRGRAELGAGMRSISCGKHIVFFEETDTEIRIVRVLHARMDVHSRIGKMSDEKS